MSDDEVVIRRGLPEHLRADAAALFEEAFGDKLGLAIPARQRRMAFMERRLRGDHLVAALREHELVGMMGLSSRDGPFQGSVFHATGSLRELWGLLGVLGSSRAMVGLTVARHQPAPVELYIDGIAVAPSARGRGIGSTLLDEALVIAREGGFRWLRLDVIDTNPRAQRLYERLGYQVTRVQSTLFLRRVLGFGSVISMELSVEALAGTGLSDPRPGPGQG